MTPKRFDELDDTAFDALVDDYIERSAAGTGELPPDVFVDVLLERIAARTQSTLTLQIHVSGDHLVITPDRETTEVVVHGNEVIIGGHRLVLQLAPQPS